MIHTRKECISQNKFKFCEYNMCGAFCVEKHTQFKEFSRLGFETQSRTKSNLFTPIDH